MASPSSTVVLPVIMFIGAAVAGCSSSPPTTPPKKGGLAPGTAQVTIDETGTTTSDAVACEPTADLP